MHYFSQIISALPLVLTSLDAAIAEGSQCKAWYDRGNHANGISPSSASASLLHAEDLATASQPRLVRRITPTKKSKFLSEGKQSACGKPYNTETDYGVCLWTGHSQPADPNLYPGWVNGAHTQNCGKKIWIEDKHKQVFYAPVVDSCPFETDLTDENVGCANIYVTENLFNAIGGNSSSATDSGLVEILSWDFEQTAN